MPHAPLRKPVTPVLRTVFSAAAASGPAAAQLAITQNAVPGDTLTVTLADPERNDDAGTVQQVTVLAENLATGEQEALTLTETAANSGVFTGSLDTLRAAGAGSDDDGIMRTLAGDTLRVTYEEPAPEATRVAETVLQGTVAAVAITQDPAPGATLTLTVTDPDADTVPGTAQQVAVTVVNGTTGESESVTLTETGAATGEFTASLATADATGAGSDDDGAMNVQGGDTLTVSYADTHPAGTRTASTTVVARPQITFLEAGSQNGNSNGDYPIALPSSAKVLIAVLFGSDGPAAPSFSNVQYNGIDMTNVAQATANPSSGNNVTVQIFVLNNPSTGAEFNFTTSWTGGFISESVTFFAIDAPVLIGGVATAAEETTDHSVVGSGLTTQADYSILLAAVVSEESLSDADASAVGLSFEYQDIRNVGIGALGTRTAYVEDSGLAGSKTVEWTISSANPIDGSAFAVVEFRHLS